MMNFSVINTKRILLRKFCEDDLTERYVAWLNDPEVVRYSEQRQKKHSLENCTKYYNSFKGTDNLFLAIIAKDLGMLHIGNITLTVDVSNRVADMAIVVGDKKVCGKGYGKEAWSILMEHLLNKGFIRKITAGTMVCNRPMLKIFHSTGMVIEGIKKKQFLLNNEEIDMIMAAKWA
jgi:[ribosomal protein S5]-alanine N-acetyltransferase